MVYWKQKPDAEFYIWIFVIIVIGFLALFKIPMLCLVDYTLENKAENGTFVQKKIDIQEKECYPLIPYFKQVKIRNKKLLDEYLELNRKAKFGEIVYENMDQISSGFSDSSSPLSSSNSSSGSSNLASS